MRGELRGEIDSTTVVVRVFNTPLSTMYKTSRQEIKRKECT
jgi:hypothetical protein